MAPQTIALTREQLYEMVWQEPVSKIAKKYTVSDVALAKACRQMGIPLPGRGYWARYAAGERRPRPRLPSPKKGAPTTYWVTPAPAEPADDRLLETTRVLLSSESVREPPSVPADLADAHPLVALSEKVLRARKGEDRFDRPARRCLDARVSEACVDRALRILDGVLRALDERGFTVEVTKPEVAPPRYGYAPPTTGPSVTRVRINDEWVPFALIEGSSSVPKPARPDPPSGQAYRDWLVWRPPPRQPNGVLQLVLDMPNYTSFGARRAWRDTANQRVEDRLADSIRGMIVMSDCLRQHRLDQERRARERQEEERRREEQERRRREEEDRVRTLRLHLERWREMRDVRAYIEEAKAILVENDLQLIAGGELDVWLRWAEGYAARIDPFSALRREAAATARAHRDRQQGQHPPASDAK